MIRDYYLGKGFITPHNYMAAFLSLEIESCTLQRSYTFSARDHWQLAHTATIMASKRSAGTGRQSSSKAAI